jgi:prolyl-tRNA editing enzyme YbaK/EbsC (Cys-tRNA(Pro) deacylase)
VNGEAWLADANTGLAVKEFPEGTRTATDAARAVGWEVGQIVKSLVFIAWGKAVVALVSGANRVDEKRLGAVAGGPVVKAIPCHESGVTGSRSWLSC